MLYRGQKEALAEFLPLDAENWITCGNALRLDWLSICPPTGTGVKLHADDLFQNAAGSGADRLRERRRRDVHLREPALSGIDVSIPRAEADDGGNLLLQRRELQTLGLTETQRERFIRRIYGSQDFINGIPRFCIWIEDAHLSEAQQIEALNERIEAVRKLRPSKSRTKGARTILAKRPHQLN